ncbi:hypothetical protein PAMP_001332 [Pampus punctatissimus]
MECRVLSIQSHVVRGYVGNKSASFPLQSNNREFSQFVWKMRGKTTVMMSASVQGIPLSVLSRH